jgi:hypothetical protein
MVSSSPEHGDTYHHQRRHMNYLRMICLRRLWHLLRQRFRRRRARTPLITTHDPGPAPLGIDPKTGLFIFHEDHDGRPLITHGIVSLEIQPTSVNTKSEH